MKQYWYDITHTSGILTGNTGHKTMFADNDLDAIQMGLNLNNQKNGFTVHNCINQENETIFTYED